MGGSRGVMGAANRRTWHSRLPRREEEGKSLTVWLTGLPTLRPWCRLSPTMKVEFCNFSGYKIYPGQVRSSLSPARRTDIGGRNRVLTRLRGRA